MRLRAAAVFLAQILCAAVVLGGEITSGSLQIQGMALEVDTPAVTTAIDIPTTVQTKFGGRINDAAPLVEGLLAVAELIGPGIDTPIQLTTAPGYRFQIPGFSREGIYYLQNIRLMKGVEFIAPATPMAAAITVANVLQTSVRVHQLTPDELRARGIMVDGRNFNVYEYSFTFLVNGQSIEIPFPVVIDPRTHEVTPIGKETPFSLPPITKTQPPRWSPPDVITFDLPPDESAQGDPNVGKNPGDAATRHKRPSIPAAIVIPNSLAVLHQFFAVLLTVSNGAPSGSTARLDDVRATIKLPSALRTVKTNPSVAFGQAVQIVDPTTGVTFLMAQARGEAEWDLEGLQPGTHTIDIEVRATLREVGQEDVPLKATPRASIVVHDPRFNITFSHPDTVRKGVEYSTYSFITNMSGATQTMRVTNGVPSCDQAAGANVCRVGGAESDDLTIASGEMKMVEYTLRPGITGHVFATAGTVNGDTLSAAVQLHMGVSETGIPLSPTTLVLPYYAQFLDPGLVDANLHLLGLGYSLATAPVNQVTARFPRVIRSDVFYRAVDIAHAGQRIFISDGAGDEKRDALANLALDLLGNGVELREWDDLRRREKSGRIAGASIIKEWTAVGMNARASISEFVDLAASATSYRTPYVIAVAHGAAVAGNARPYALSIRGSSGRRADVPNEAASGWIRDLPFADVSRFDVPAINRAGEIALVGRWTENVDLVITPAVSGPVAVELVFPGANDGTEMRAHLDLNVSAGEALRVPLTRGATTVNAIFPNGGFSATAAASAVTIAPLRAVAARQDLNLDREGHKVSVLFNRPVSIQTGGDWKSKFAGRIAFNRDGVVYNGDRSIFAAALQEDERIVNLSFDNVLTANADYTIAIGPLVDPVSKAEVGFGLPMQPKIDNARPAGIVYGKFLKGDNTPIGAAEVRLYSGHFKGCQSGLLDDEPPVDCNPYAEAPQYGKTEADGTFLFEYIPRDPISDEGLTGSYRLLGVSSGGRFTIVEGAVRLPRRVHFVNLQLLGRGAAEGTVKYSSGERVTGADVYVGSTMFNIGRTAKTDANGFFHVDDLAVGPITFTATDVWGNVAYASGEIATPGQLITKDLLIVRKPNPGTATAFGVVRRSDTSAPVVAARVGVYWRGFGVAEALTDTGGRFEFRKVPAGFVTVLAAEWSVSRQSASVDFDLHADEVHEASLTLSVASTNAALASLSGDVMRENPLFPGDPSKYERVAGAIVRLGGRPVTADGSGRFTFDALPLSWGNSGTITAYDSSTRRFGSAPVPTLTEAGPNNVSIFLGANSFGSGTVRVRLISATGQPVAGFRVIEPGFPPTPFRSLGGGLYELATNVGGNVEVWAVNGPPEYGDQYAHDTVRLEFPGQIASVTLRLPGLGTVRVKLHGDFDVIGDVSAGYLAWDESEQMARPKDPAPTASTSEGGVAGYATFIKIPALQSYTVESNHPSYGYASASGTLAYDGDLATHILQLKKLATIRGTVYAIDGRTPIAGAAVRLNDGSRDTGVTLTQPDGTFVYTDVPAGIGFSLVAETTQSGIYRTGVAYGKTSPVGGPVSGLSVILRRRGTVEGRVVYLGYKKFDSNNPANNVPDDTPGDLTDNAPAPLAKLWLKELDFPARSFGSDADPLSADISGRFALSNIFVGALHAKSWDPGNQELRGDWNGTLDEEGQPITAWVGIGAGGSGNVQVTIADPNQSNQPVANAEVGLYRGGVFDLTSSDANGVATFQQVPVGTFSINAYSKALGKSGSSATFAVQKDLVSQMRVLLEFSGKVDGTLSDPEAVSPNGVAGAFVTLIGTGYQARASTNTSGLFTFDGVREGLFALDAKDTESNRRAKASRTLSAADPHPIVSLELERTATLNLSVYLPDDTGAISAILGGPVSIDVNQRYGDFARSMQGNPIVMPRLLLNEPYGIAVHELGGQQRELSFKGSFPKGSATDPIKLVYAAYGTVDVTVTQSGSPAIGARVSIAGGGRSATLFTDAGGKVTAPAMRLGDVSAQATSVDGRFSGSAAGRLDRTSVPSRLSIDLGAFAGVTGLVEAEAGGPSVGTRVLASFAGRTLEVPTGSDGRYTFNGIPTTSGGTAVALTYIGSDDVMVGARQTATLFNDSASKVITLPSVRLDATPPQIVSIAPADGAQNVSPDTTIRLTFSERIRTDQISNSYLQLVPADGTGQVAALFDAPVVAVNGTFIVTMHPPPPPAGQRFPLRSNTLYRLIVSGAIEDLTGHRIPAPLGITFTTSDYTEPHVIKVIPSTATAVPEQVTFQFHFSEAVDPAPWQPGGSAAFHFYKLSAPGPAGQIVAEKAGRAYIDPATSLILYFAPADPIEPESFYRAVFSGIRDMQGNALAEQTFHFFSFDKTKPFVRFVSPVPAGFALVSGVEYVLGVDLRNGTADGTAATDVASVDYLRVDGAAETYLTTVRSTPFGYRFVAPEAPAAGMTYTLRARATDGSGNVSDPSTITWTVKPNAPPGNVAVSFAPTSAYPANSVVASVTFDDEGTFATVVVVLTAAKLDGSPYTTTQTKQITRTTVADAWPAAQLTFALPADLNPAVNATFAVTATDVRGLNTTVTAFLPLLTDTGKPAILSVTPAAETRYNLNDRYTIEATVTDLETAVAEVNFTVDGQTSRVLAGSSGVVAGATPGSKKFSSPQITVPAKNIDTRIPVVVTAKDYQGNSSIRTFELIYIGVNDPAVPKGSWLCPVDRGVIPAAQSTFILPLRVQATDDIAVTSVRFRVPGVTTPFDAARVGTTDEYVATVTLTTTPAAGSDFVLTAIISDADTTHTIELPIAMDVVTVDKTVDATQAIGTGNIADFDNRSVLVRSATGRLVPHVPVTFRNLIVLDGGRVESIGTTTTLEQKIDITVVDRLYVDCASSIDVTARGYLGGWGANPDGSNTRNESAAGRTVGNTATGGAVSSGASHGGLGAAADGGVANATYDTLSDPTQLGSGGGGGPDSTPGGTGGGAISIRASAAADAIGRIAVAGSLRADGAGGTGTFGGGSGGSIRINGRQVIAGGSAHITANGGEAAPSSAIGTGLAGSGGRIAVIAGERLDVPSVLTQFEVHGGSTPSYSRYLGAGAGTIYLRRPAQTNGELYVGKATTGRPVRATPLGFIGSGTASTITANSLTDATRAFDPAVVGEELFFPSQPARSYTVTTVSSDRHALMTDPADGDITVAAAAGAAYRGLIRGDRIELGANALARFEESVATGSSIDSSTSVVKNAGAAVVLYSDRPTVSVSTTPAAGSIIIRATALDVAFDAASVAGAASALINLSAVPVVIEPITGYPTAVTAHHVIVPVPPTATLGGATLSVRIVDRADRFVDAPVANFTVIDNLPPALDTFTAVPESVYPGKTVSSTISASDDVAVTKISLTSQIGTNTPSTQAVTPTTKTATQAFGVTVPITTPGGSPMTIEAVVEDNYPGRASVRQTKNIVILKDTVPPAVTFIAPAANQLFNEATGAMFTVTVNATDAEVGVKNVTVTVGDAAAVPMAPTSTANQWRADVPVPNVDGVNNVTIPVVVNASDYEGNSASAGINVQVKPLIDPNAPSISWTCGTAGAMGPAGYAAQMRVFAKGATTSNGVQKVEFFANGSATPIAATAVSGVADQYQASYIIPALADGTVVPIRAVATSVSGNTSDLTTRLTVVAADSAPPITGNLTIDASNAVTYDGKTVIVQSGTLTVTGAHTFDRLLVLGGSVTYPAGGSSKLDVTVTRAAFIACGAVVDATGTGWPANQTYPAATVGATGDGGSHIGIGGVWTSAGASTFGSVGRPQEAGGGGESTAGGAAGGGVIRMSGASIVNDGTVRANGANGDRGGAGGSIWITTTAISGTGSVQANGGTGNLGSGGGGAILIDQNGTALVQWTLSAKSNTASQKTGGAGSVLLRNTNSIHGDLIVDNGAFSGEAAQLPSLGRGVAQAGSSSAMLVTDRQTDIPPYFVGHWVDISSATGTGKGSWRIGAVNAKSVTLVPNAGENVSIDPGDKWQGVYRFDSLKLRRARLITEDRIFITAPADLDTFSATLGNNAAPPVLDGSKITIQVSATGSAVIGNAGAVSDIDTPVSIIATNTRTAQITTAAASANGSFVVPVQGNGGDTITIKARDGNFFPLESAVLTVGTLSASAPAVTQLNKTAWTSDASFKAQTIAVDGTILAVTSASTVNGSASDKMAVLDITDPAHPTFARTIAAVGSVRDFKIVNGWAYVGGDRFGTIDLRNSTSTMNFACDTGGYDQAVAVSGGYAFTAENYNADGRIYVYDVSNPAAPRCTPSDQQPLAGQGMDNTVYTDLLAYGMSYLVGVSNGSSGWDVVVIDRRDVNAMKMIGRLQIPNFVAWRGRMRGSLLYVISATSGEMVVVDLANAALPAIAARLPLPSPSGGLRVLEDAVLIANTSSGVVATTVDAAQLGLTGAAATGGNAMDVAVTGGFAYVANEVGVAVVPITVAPVVDPSKITMSTSGTMLTVTGAARAITTGSGPAAVQVIDSTTAASMTVTVSADGSFTSTIPADGGDAITIKATDAQNRASGPVPIGQAPFGSSTKLIPIVISSDPNFRARAVKVEGSMAVVASYPAYNLNSSNLVVYDISNPAAPVQTRVVSTVGTVRDFELLNGWAYVGGDRFGTIDLRNSSSTMNFPCDTGGYDQAVAVSGGYAFTAENYNADGRIYVYDVTNPAAPRCMSADQQPLAGMNMDNTIYNDLLAWGTSYLIGISNGVSGWDVVVIDRRDVNAMKMVGRLQIPQIVGFRGRLAGSMLYVAGQEGGVATVDLTNPASPRLVSVLDTPGQAYGIDVAGTTAMVADRSVGVTFLDNSTGTLRQTGTQPVGGDAWDVALGGTSLYIANEQGLAVLNDVVAPPRIVPSLITVGADATVSAQPGAITGLGSLTVDVTNSATGASRTMTLSSGSAFTTPITASAGDAITIKATDAFGRYAGPVVIGNVPFGSATKLIPIVIASDPNFRARAVKVEGSMAVVGSYPAYNLNSSNLVVYDISNPAAPVQTRVVSTVGTVRDFELVSGWAYVGGDRFGTIDLRNSSSTMNFPCDTGGYDQAVAVSGGYAFTAENYNADGRIYVYDVTNPAAPRCMSADQQPLAGMNMDNTIYNDLLAWGTSYLIGISNGVSGWDVVVIDRRDVNAMKMVGRLQIPQIVGFRGRLAGSMLYVAGQEGGVATVDLTNPASPRLVSVLDTPGQAYGIDVAGTTAMVADRSVGVTFLDNSTGTLRQTGTQPVGGDAWDVAHGGTSLYIANEQGLAVLNDVVAPPDVVPSFITTLAASASSATITGANRAAGGQPPVQIVVNAEKGGTSGNVNVMTGGSFTATVPARNGETLSLTATDGRGRASTKSIGAVPFATIVTEQRGTRDEDLNFFARRIASDGTNIVVTGGTQSGARLGIASTRALLFKQPNASDPPTLATLDTGGGFINDEEVRAGYAYIAGDRLSVIDYASPTPVRYFASTAPSGRDYAVALAGNYAFAAEGDWNHNGGVRIYNVTTPITPVYVATVAVSSTTGIDYRDLIASGTLLFAISPDANRDVTVIDISTPTAPVRLAELDVPNFKAFAGAIDGTTLYLAGGDSGIAIVDVSNPAAPQLRSVIDTPGIALAVAASGTNEVVVADSAVGLTFIDTTNKQSPILLGSQPLQGNASDVKALGNQIYAATQTRFYVLKRP